VIVICGLGVIIPEVSRPAETANPLQHSLLQSCNCKGPSQNSFIWRTLLENYVICTKLSERKYFSRLRTSSHWLHIETGRHKRPATPPGERFCNDSSIEDEFHFMLYCKSYAHFRKTLYSKLDFLQLKELSSRNQFLLLMSYNNGDTEILKLILKFVDDAYESRFPHSYRLHTLIMLYYWQYNN
jgi:hypothetical protein